MKMPQISSVLGLLIPVFFALASQAQTIHYVKSGGTGDGSSWGNAASDLQATINAAEPGDEIWVAEGEYQPAPGESFQMAEGVGIYGGFEGTESALAERDWKAHPTILRGNGTSVVLNPRALELSRSARLDGFTVTGGSNWEGGGIYSGTDATFANLVVRGNTGTGSGGGIRNFASALYYNILITENSSPMGGGFFTTVEDSEPVLVNVTSSGNMGGSGNEFYYEAGSPTVVNSILFGTGVRMATDANSMVVRHSLVQNQTSTQYGNVDGRNIPLFTDPVNGDYSLSPASAAINAGSNEAYIEFVSTLDGLDIESQPRVQQGTIDMGALESPHVRTLDPTAQILYVSGTVDQTVPGYRGDGSSWDHAVPDVASALWWTKEHASNWTEGTPLQVWVASGYYEAKFGQPFEMVDHVQIYGRFEGTESELADRNLTTGNVTALVGKSSTVIFSADNSRQARLDGFHITGGEADWGGGIRNYGDATFANLEVSANSATDGGGGIYNEGSPLLHDVLVRDNFGPQASEFYNTGTGSAPVLVNVTIVGEENAVGQLTFNRHAGNPVIRNTIIYGNGVGGLSDAEDIQYSFVQGLTGTANGNIPDEDFPLLDFPMPGLALQFFLVPTSWTINAGSNDSYLSLVGETEEAVDVLGMERVQQGTIDIGAMETPFKKALVPGDDHTIYVNQSVDLLATGYKGDGSSWVHAAPDLADVLQWANVYQLYRALLLQFSGGDISDLTPLNVFVAQGKYVPRYTAELSVDFSSFYVDGGRDNAFVLPMATRLYGGFNGTESGLEERDWYANKTILSGDLAGDDNPESPATNLADNAYHVVVAAGVIGDAALDGFTVTGGNAEVGGSGVTVNDEDIRTDFGGGMVISNADPEVANTIFSGNQADAGGGLAIFGSDARISNSLFSGNSASGYGGGILNANSAATLINTTIAGNQSGNGGGLFITPSEMPLLRNTLIYGNSSGPIAAVPIETMDIQHSLIQEMDFEGTNGNLNGNDPALTPELVFVAPQAPGLSNGGDYRLAPTSPAINTGNDGFFPGDAAGARDLAGRSRFRGASIDMGAFEEADLRLVELGDVADITVPFGTALADMPIPGDFVVEGTLDDASTVDIGLSHDATQWTLLEPVGGAYDAHTAGTYLFAVDLTVEADVFANPEGLQARVRVIVEKGVPVITWNDPAPITYGVALDGTQLNASADVPGSWVYDPTAGTELPVGTHTLQVAFTPEDEANYVGASHEVTLVVEKAEAFITADAVQTHVYDGTVKNIVASLDHEEAVLAYSPQPGYTEAGTYEITVTAEETANYEAVSAVVTLQIDPAVVTGIGLEDASFVYDGTAKSIEIAGTLPTGASVAYTIDGLRGNEATDAGAYEVRASISGDNYETMELTAQLAITPRAVTVTAVDVAKVYGEADPAFTYRFTPALVDGDEFTGALTRDAGDDAGSYPIRQGDLSLGGNYDIAFEAGVLTITKAQPVITAAAIQQHVYDGTAKAVQASVVPAELADRLQYSPQQTFTNVGEYRVRVFLDESANYLGAEAYADFAITPARQEGLTLADLAATYDGQPHALEVAGAAADASVSYTINGEPGNSAVDAGIYEVIAKVIRPNYADATLTGTLQIARALLTGITFGDATFTYDGTARSLDITGTLPEGTTVSYTIDGRPGNEATDAGDYEVVATISSGNYETLVLTARLVITAPEVPQPITGITLKDASFTYDGTAKSLAVSGTLPEGTSVSYENNSLTAVGTQTVTATIAGDNYETLVLTGVLTVTPAERTITFPALPAKTYGAADFNAGATASSGEAVSYTSSNPEVAEVDTDGTVTITGVGETTLTATVPENGNYTSRPTVSRTLTVQKATQAITSNAPAEVNRDAGTVPLDISANSGLPVELTIDDEEVATLDGTSLNILRLGTVRITATQEGDANHEPAEPVTVTVRVTDPSAALPVRVHKAVSPNGDGINEYLIIEAIKEYPDNRVSIFNRNGTVVWEASGYNNGTVAFRGVVTGGHYVPAGTYFYVAEIKVNGEWKYEKGWFVLRY